MAGGDEHTPDEDRAVRMRVMRAMERAWTGRVGEAIAMLSGDKTVMAHAFGLRMLGTLHLESRHLQDALDAFSAAAALSPESGEARCNVGVALQQIGRLGEALAAYDEAIRLQPVNVTAHFNRGVVLRLANRLDEAEAAFGNAVDLDPKMVQAHVNRGLVRLILGRHHDALASFDRALALSPGNADLLQARAAALQALGQPVVQPPALTRPPPPPPPGAQAAVARSRVLIELERYEEALALAGAVQRQGPVGAQALMAKAAALWKLGRVSEALGAGNAAIRLDPDNSEIHEEFSYYCLKLGDYERGWAEYEYRLGRPQRRLRLLAPDVPLWRGEVLAGKRVAVLTEQGHGDTLHFVRYLGALHERGAVLTGFAQPVLLELLRSCPVPATWIEKDAAAGEEGRFDFHVPLLSLPHRFATRRETIPADVPYLFADEAKAAAWRARLGREGFKVGVAWQGNPEHPSDHLRSVALAALAPLAAVPGVRLISLQARHGLHQLVSLPSGMAVEDLGPTIGDNPDGMAEIAAVMAGLDLVVTINSAVAHLAGALGRPVWVALMADPDWRWLLKGEASPWYPTARLFRQQKPGDWGGVFAAMAKALAERADPASLA